MSLDLTNSNKLDDSFVNFTTSKYGVVKSIVPTGLPTGDRLEDEFGGSAKYYPFKKMLPYSKTLEPKIFDAGRGNIYESTPYGYFLDEEAYSNLICEQLSFVNNNYEDEYSNGSGKLRGFFQQAAQTVKQTTQNVVQNIQKGAENLGQNIQKGAENLGKGVTNLAQSAQTTFSQTTQSIGKGFSNLGKNIKGTVEDARQNLQAAIDSAKKWVGDNLGGGVAVHYLNRVNPVFIAMRGAVISLLELNVVGLATAMNAIKTKGANRYEEVLQKWWMWGGDKTRYDEAVQTGKDKKKMFLRLVMKAKGIKGVDGTYYYADANYYYAEGDEESETEMNPAKMVLVASTALGSLGGVLAAIPSPDPATKGAAAWTTAGSGAFGALGGIMKNFAKEQGATDEETSSIPESSDLPNADVPTTEAELLALRQQIELAKQGKEPSINPVRVDEKGNLKTPDDEDKILGMPKPLFFTLAGILVIGGAFLTYKYIKKK